MRLIDFDHTVIKADTPDSANDDSGAGIGIRNLIHTLDTLLFSHTRTHSFTELPTVKLTAVRFLPRGLCCARFLWCALRVVCLCVVCLGESVCVCVCGWCVCVRACVISVCVLCLCVFADAVLCRA